MSLAKAPPTTNHLPETPPTRGVLAQVARLGDVSQDDLAFFFRYSPEQIDGLIFCLKQIKEMAAVYGNLRKDLWFLRDQKPHDVEVTLYVP